MMNNATVKALIPAINRGIRYVASDCTEIDDVMQNALFKLAQASSKRGDITRASYNYAFRIGMSAGCDWIRGRVRERQYRRAIIDDEDEKIVFGGIACPRPTAEYRAEQAERQVYINGLVEQLSPAFQGVVRLRLSGLDYEQIAATEGVPIGTVKSRLARAKDALSKLLAAY